MAKRKEKAKYGDHTVVIGGQLYGSIRVKDSTGKVKQIRKKVSTKKEANDWAISELAKIQNNGGVLKEDPKMPISKLANWFKHHYLVAVVRDKDQKKVCGQVSWRENRRKLDKFVEHFGGMPIQTIGEKENAEEQKMRSTVYEGGMLVSQISTLALENYVKHRVLTDDVSVTTANRDMALIRSMFIAGKPMHECELPKFPIDGTAEHERTVTIDFAQEQLILAACVDYETITCKKKKSGKVYTQRIHCNRSHLRPLVIAALDTALRKSEMKKLDWKDVDLEKKIITIMYYTTKVPTTRKVPISTRLKEELEKFPHRKGLVFLHLGDNKKAWKTVLKRVGLPSDVRWHDLRHTGTTNLVDSGVAQAIAMKITGHTQNKTFNRYVNPNDMAIQNAGAKMEEHRLRHEQLLVDESSQAVN